MGPQQGAPATRVSDGLPPTALVAGERPVRPLVCRVGPQHALPRVLPAGVLVARHGPLLANAVFLPPGALVLELLPYNW